MIKIKKKKKIMSYYKSISNLLWFSITWEEKVIPNLFAEQVMDST